LNSATDRRACASSKEFYGSRYKAELSTGCNAIGFAESDQWTHLDEGRFGRASIFSKMPTDAKPQIEREKGAYVNARKSAFVDNGKARIETYIEGSGPALVCSLPTVATAAKITMRLQPQSRGAGFLFFGLSHGALGNRQAR
jgi:hypothetical protein